MNKVILVGRLAKEPELRSTANGVNVCSFAVACDRKYVKQGEERKADFINCIAWRQIGESIAKYFTKGTRIALEGTLQTRSWTGTDNKTHYAMEVIVEDWEFAQSKNEGGQTTQPAQENATKDNYGGETQGAYDSKTDIDGFMPIDDVNLPF